MKYIGVLILNFVFLYAGAMDQTNHAYTLKSQMEGHTDTVWCLAPLLQTYCASGSMDKTVRQWDLRTQQCVKIFEGHTDCIASVATFLGLIFSGSSETIKLWDIRQKEAIHTCKASATTLAIPHKDYFLSGSTDCKIRKWDLRTYQCIDTLDETWNERLIWGIAVDGDNVVVGSIYPDVAIFNMKTKELVASLQEKGYQRSIKRVMVDPATRNIISASLDNTIKIWNQKTEKCEKTLECTGGKVKAGVYGLALDAQNRIVAGTWDHMFSVWDKNTGINMQQIDCGEPILDLKYQNNNVVAAIGNNVAIFGSN